MIRYCKLENMVKIIGIDFSGADETREVNTWITEGQLEGSQLKIISCPRSINRNDLTELLLKCHGSNTVAAMDFPFSVPWDFAQYWKPTAIKMPELWRVAAKMKLGDFNTKCRDYAAKMPEGKKHPLRIGDLYSSKPLSCLNGRIRPMTFHGMQMLHHLWESNAEFRVPPLDDSGRAGPVLLEVMPGAALESFSLLYEPYKTVTKTTSKSEIGKNRKKILGRLETKSRVEITNLNDFMGTYLNHHDGIDSLVAAVVAARWVLDKDKSQFCCPLDTPTDYRNMPNPQRRCRASKKALAMSQVEAARREGWIYVPKK